MATRDATTRDATTKAQEIAKRANNFAETVLSALPQVLGSGSSSESNDVDDNRFGPGSGFR